MDKLPLRMNLPFPGVQRGQSFGLVHRFALTPPTSEERLFAFAVTERLQPQVFDFANDEQGLQALANLIRSEDVLVVVRGQQAPFETSSLVEVSIGGRTHQDRMPIPRGM